MINDFLCKYSLGISIFLIVIFQRKFSLIPHLLFHSTLPVPRQCSNVSPSINASFQFHFAGVFLNDIICNINEVIFEHVLFIL